MQPGVLLGELDNVTVFGNGLSNTNVWVFD